MSKRKLHGFQRKQVINQSTQDFSGYQKARDSFMGGATPTIFHETDEIEAIIQRSKNINARDVRYRSIR